ncbi:choice-of-anchor K domain-containing protein [Candidatus Dojkabacteria bacterium]|nr:choice-of-anchor K domain-containing protein [Candidatus Dojkabacteria bacterium]
MKLNKKSFLKSLYKVSTVLFLVGYNFAQPFLAIRQLLDIGGEITPVAAADGPYTISSTSGIWTKVEGTSNYSGVNTSEIRWGTGNPRSGLKFTSAGTQTFDADQKFLIGDLTHMNWPVSGGTADSATLKVTLNFSQPPLSPNPTFSYKFNINETSNGYSPYTNCPGYAIGEQLSKTPCDDVITFPNAYGQGVFTIGDMKYTLKIDGFQSQYPTGDPVSKFITEEKKNNVAYLVGHLSSVLVEKPAISIEKYVAAVVEGEEDVWHDADTAPGMYIGKGDEVKFKYVVQNTGNVKLTNIVVTDNKGVTVSCPSPAELEAGGKMTCNSVGNYYADLGLYTNIGTVEGTHAGGTVTASDPANYTGVNKIRICHATKSGEVNPYNNAQASMTGDVQGHDSHHGNVPPRVWYPGIQGTWDDIIPPFNNEGISYPGKNWDAYGQSVYYNNCTIPTGTLKVNKVTVPAGDNTEFAITGSGESAVTGAPTFMNGNTGTISSASSHTFTVYPGTYSVAETKTDGWKEVSNTCKDIVVANGKNEECTITNTKYSSLTIIKNATPRSEEEFSFTTTGEGLENFKLVDNSDTSNPSKVFENLLPGNYSVNEIIPEQWNWYLDKVECTDGKNHEALTLSAGENITCTFNNVEYGSISGHKWNDFDGIPGTADDKLNPIKDWTIFIDANNNNILDPGETSMLTGVDGKYSFTKLEPGTYKIMEVLQLGWINITGKSQSITITAGENRVDVDFSNVKYPTIQVIKNVDTDGNGSVDKENAKDWTWKLGVNETYDTGIDPVEKMPGTYTISEVQKDNYHVTSLVCTKNGTEIVNKVSESTDITLQSGDKVVCTFTNTRDTGTLIVQKVVVNDNGGELKAGNFSFKVNNGATVTFNQSTANPLFGENTITKVPTGSYSIVEVEADQRGYATTYSNDCNGQLNKGDIKTCVITNNDNAPKLELVKTVTNDNGGTLGIENWKLIADDGEASISGFGGVVSGDNFKAGTYTLSEEGKEGVDVSGYKAGNWSCEGATVNGNQVVVPFQGNVKCTINNNDIAPKLTLNKIVSNTHGGNNPESDWMLYATKDNVVALSGAGAEGDADVVSGETFQAGTYTLSEEGKEGVDVSGYTASDWECIGGVQNGSTIKLGVGEEAVCSITNSDTPAQLTVIKQVKNDDGGQATVEEFEIKNNGTKLTFGTGSTTGDITEYKSTPAVESNTTYTLTEKDHYGYTEGTWTCIDDVAKTPVDHPVTLKEGQKVTCTVLNDDIAPKLTIVKNLNIQYGGTAQPDDFKLTVGGVGVLSGETNEYLANTPYAINEKSFVGYEFVSITGSNKCPAVLGGTITLDLADNITCTITNKDLPATVTVYKDVLDGFSNDIFKVQLEDGGEKLDISDTKEADDRLVAVFRDLDRGEYYPEEVELPDGYIAEGCVPLEGSSNTVENGMGIEFVCTNKVIDPLLNIEKSNDKQHIDQYAGDEVTYTITVTAPEDGEKGTYVLNNVVVSDIAPAGFKYISGTWTAQKNGVDISVPEPTYDDKGQAKWNIGDMKEGDVVVLTYKTRISLLQDPGNYPDIAWVEGKSLIDGQVLGASTVDPETPFVGTDVTVIDPIETEEGEVLGASITLPVTGASTYLTLGALIMMFLGAITLLLKPFKKLSYALLTGLMALSFVTLLTPNRVLAADSDIQVRIMQPATPTNKTSFNVGFVALDLNNKEVTVECYKDGTLFKTIPNANAGNCPATVDASGTYTFYVIAKSASGEQKSEDAIVVVDLVKPSPVIDYSKAGNVIKFKTGNDAKVVKVEIHRSTTPKYTANESTRVKTMNVEPNEEYSWTDTTAEAGKTYYYALRTVDAIGNTSTIVSDPEVVEVPAATTGTATTIATTNTRTGDVAGQTDTKKEGEVAGETDDITEGEDTEVKKTEEGKEKVDIKETGKNILSKWYFWVIVVVVIGGVAFYVRKQKSN